MMEFRTVKLSLFVLIIFFVCPPSCQLFSCTFNVTVKDQKQPFVYNFSRLSRQEVWEAEIKKSSEIAYISVCHPLNILSSPCKNSPFCIAKQSDGSWHIVLSSTGSYQIDPRGDGRNPVIQLSGAQQCLSDNSRNYSVEIHVNCSSTDEEPLVVGYKDDCELLVLWKTSAGCPVIKECVLENYDFSALYQPNYYDILGPGGCRFQLNLCGSLNSSACISSNTTNAATACEVFENKTQPVIIGQLDRQKLIVDKSGITLTYSTSRKGFKTEVKFICRSNPQDIIPKFVKLNGKIYMFEMETELACKSWHQECVAFDGKGVRFDLKSLRRNNDNWVVQSTTPGQKYYINVCGPLNSASSLGSCSDGITEACLITAEEKTINLGTVARGPTMVEDILTLEYSGGAVCPEGGRHTVEIQFTCSNNNRGPVYIHTRQCVHYFSWETADACPTLLDIGKNCIVTEVRFGHRYNLNVLRSASDKFISTADHFSYELNMCGPLQKLCNNQNASVCLVKNGKEIAIGKETSTVVYENGGLKFVSHGEGCNSNFSQSTVTIILLCRHGDDPGEPEFFPERDCDFTFVWYTSAACPPHYEIEHCSVEDKGTGYVYDLSPLSEVLANHIVVKRKENLKFSLNVCHSLVFGTEAGCEYTSAACMLNMSEPNPTKRFTNIGDLVDGPYFENNKLKIKYKHGDLCHVEDGPDHQSTIITFECDEFNRAPVPLPGDICVYEFLWRTKAACPIRIPSLQGQHKNECIAEDPITGKRFDLTPLRNQVKTISDMEGHNYTFVVCGNLSTSACGNGKVGICQEKTDAGKSAWSAGVGTSKLIYRQRILLLEYKDGSPCNGSLKRTTTIEFVCSEQEQIVFIDELAPCSYLIRWQTNLACSKQTECSSEVDLSPLIRHDKNYEVKMNGTNTVFYINVCNPLLPVPKLGCSGSSALCMAYVKDGKIDKEQSLGSIEEIRKQSDGKFIIDLKNGTDPNTGAEIILQCDLLHGIGEPQFDTLSKDPRNQTKYMFLWRTNVTCEEYEKDIIPNDDHCIIRNDQLDGKLDLKKLGHHGMIRVQGTRFRYLVNLCGADIHAEDGKTSHLLGKLASVTFYYQQRQASLRFIGGSKCSVTSPGQYMSEVVLYCVPDHHYKEPEILNENDCSVSIQWENSAVCEVVVPGYPHRAEHTIEEAHGSSVGTILSLVVLAAVVCSLFLYFRKPSNRSQLRSRLSSWLGMRHSGQFHYSRLEAADEASQLLVSHVDGQESDSDDELLRM